ncbi:bifunctional diguanylate cyclase/phosphodiesterase [Thiomicrospira sp. ALE5]|uniref:bifunctional diguanylate cyclase/phosphodiesterase n=1 Tax=Thiomicrospira sp. ALE5 TaxID=748650 RepID=UPI001F22196B|nr:bifunctional diguanylate cyclase/phosphodiesterase [Thiomicrospira sp. ALE5]
MSVSLGVYLLMFGYLYSSAQSIKTQTTEQIELLSEHEVRQYLSQFVEQARTNAAAMAEWDEVHQQLNQSRYYFFWRNQRVTNSPYWRNYFNDFELYSAKGSLLFMKGPNDPVSPYLAEQIADPMSVFQFDRDDIHLRIFLPVMQRNGSEVSGYIGLSFNFMKWLQQRQQFQYIDKASLHPASVVEGDLVASNYVLASPGEYLTYQTITSPVDNLLWALIQDFIFYVLVYAVVVAILFVAFFRFSLINPLFHLTQYLAELKKRPNAMIRPNRHYLVAEFEQLQESLFKYNQALHITKQELRDQHNYYSKQTRIDALSGLLNRFAFDELMQELAESSHSNNRTVGFILVDCDYFKAINDTYGLEVGDRVIQMAAQTMTDTLPDHATIFRMGGDEFAAILNIDTAESLKSMAATLLETLNRQPFKELGIQERVSFSVGLSISAQVQTLQHLLKNADIALYQAKHSLHDKVQLFVADELSAAHTLMSNKQIGVIVHALQTGEGIEMHVQPVVDLDERIHYFEALIRIRKDGVLIFPGDIFNVVNHRHLDVDLDKQVIKAVTQLFVDGLVNKGLGLSFNLSPHSLLQLNLERELAELASFTQDYKIIVEITETSLVQNMELVTLKLNALREIGFLVALDDFGSGYSSIRYLANMPVDIVKFDMTLTRALELDEKTRGIVQATAKMIREAGYQLVMEGIETPSQFTAAQQAGATAFQGYLFGKPLPLPRGD